MHFMTNKFIYCLRFCNKDASDVKPQTIQFETILPETRLTESLSLDDWHLHNQI
jgi:hypothetical protein